MARKKLEPVDEAIARAIGGLLRDLRRAAGYRAARDAASRPGCPAAQQTIYAYERGGLVPSLKQFMELVEFYAFQSREDLLDAERRALRYQAVAAMVRALALPAYHVTGALDLIARLQPSSARPNREPDDVKELMDG